jgi:lysophospholipid acyltransferase (LPLAT)-like uncharacterized protein
MNEGSSSPSSLSGHASSRTLHNRYYYNTISIVVSGLLHCFARTWRWKVFGYERFRKLEDEKIPVIYAFWHGRILPATFFWRNRGIVVLTSENEDGEYIARVIQRFGYGSSRGSTSRGAVKGMLGLMRTLRDGLPVAFTVDGPRGPRYQVQQGVTWLASYAQYPILPFHIEAYPAKTLSSWDAFQIPLPFSRVRVDIAEPMYLEKDLSEEVLEIKRLELQQTLNHLREKAEVWVRNPAGNQ